MKLERFLNVRNKIYLRADHFNDVISAVESRMRLEKTNSHIDEMALFTYYFIKLGYPTYRRTRKGIYIMTTEAYRNRSFSDIYNLLYTYYDLSLRTYVEVLDRLMAFGNESGSGRGVNALFCPNINKFVFNYDRGYGVPYNEKYSHRIEDISTEFCTGQFSYGSAIRYKFGEILHKLS